jgi:hypothetical protein
MANNNSSSVFTPFRSGCGMCKASTDYYQQPQAGGNNYSEDGLIPTSNGKNFFKTPNFDVSSEMLMKNNYDKEYSTAFGGKKSVKKPVKKPVKKTVKKSTKVSKKKKMKGGDYASFSNNNVIDKQDITGIIDDTIYQPANIMMGGYNVMDEQSVTGALDDTMYQPENVMMGGVPTGEYQHLENEIKSIHSQLNKMQNEIDSEISQNGGKGKKTKKTKETKETKKTKKTKKTKETKKKIMKGGMESDGATPMHQRFYNTDATLDNYPEISGNGIMSAYGPIVSGNVGTGMLAPYTSSTCPSANHNTLMKTGGSKSKNNSKKLNKKNKQHGGMESSGATSLPQRFYNPNISDTPYSEDSGNNMNSAYGKIQANDVGSGLLAPFNKSMTIGMKTGGSKKNKKNTKSGNKKNKKNMKGGKENGPIPQISSTPVTDVQNALTGAVNDFSKFMEKLDQDYINSVKSIENMKIGNQRLIQGGKKVKKSSDKKKKTPKKKSVLKKKTMKGGDGSDFALTLNSRGPANYPDNTWGVDGETWFRQFSKTGQYIPNSQLANAATPLLAGTNNSNIVSGFNEMENNYGKV